MTDDYWYDPVWNAPIYNEEHASTSETVTVVAPFMYQVGFSGDHQLYQTPTTPAVPSVEWGDSSAPINDPVWILGNAAYNAANNHVCYTRGSTVSYTAVKCAVSQVLTEGAGIYIYSPNTCYVLGSVEFNTSSCVSSATSLSGTYAFPAVVQTGTFSPTWAYVGYAASGPSPSYSMGSTSHNYYLTYGTPYGGCRTVRRINQVCTNASGTSTATNAGMALWTVISGFFNIEGTYGIDLTTPEMIWVEGYGSPGRAFYGAYGLDNQRPGLDCNGVSKAFEEALKMLGVPFSGGVVFLYPVPGGTVQEGGAQVTRNLAYTGGDMPAGNYVFTYLYVDGAGGQNNYESCLKVSFDGGPYKYFAPGAGVYNSAYDALAACISSTRWLCSGHYWPDDANMNRAWSENPPPVP